ncbi:MAG: DUF3187 family protein [Planctomycetes bacterium]|nr:DUF3187 family protein [Planctomycetota bacterium]
MSPALALMSRTAPLVVAALLAGCVSAPRFAGPLPVRDQHPAQLTVGRLLPRAAAAEAPGSVRADWTNAYSSLFLAGGDSEASFRMDGEYLRSALAARVGLGHGLDVELEVPVAHTTAGFLDDFIIEWHDAFGLPDQNRDDRPRDEFVIEADRGGVAVWQVEKSGFELLDVPLAIAWSPLSAGTDGRFGVTLRAGVELPTGAARRGYGSGGFDWMLGVAAEARLERVSLTAHVQHTFASTPAQSERAGFSFHDVTVIGAGVEVPVLDDLTLLAQTDLETSTLRGLDFDRAANAQWLLWTGARLRIAERAWVDIAIGEDLSSYIAPDLSAWIGFHALFGGADGAR